MVVDTLYITVRELTEGFIDTHNEDIGVLGYNGKLVIRPPYQREFVYNDKQKKEVIKSVYRGLPLNLIYWADKGNHYELLDGQQRTLSICQYVANSFSVENLEDEFPRTIEQIDKNKILDYVLEIKICKGTENELMDWFRIINTQGEPLKEQEMLNAIYCGSWTEEAKKVFSKRGCFAYYRLSKYIKGALNRQDYLHTALKWIADRDKISIPDYMGIHQNDSDCKELKNYTERAVDWFESIFPDYYKFMEGLPVGILYNKYNKNQYDKIYIKEQIKNLINLDNIKQSGIFEYLLDFDNPNREKYLNIRAFKQQTINKVYEKQNHLCGHCGKELDLNNLEAHHIKAWYNGGETVESNCILLCKDCHNKETKKLLNKI